MAFIDYRTKYPRMRMSRDDQGVLEIVLNTEGGPLLYTHSGGPSPQAEFADAFADIAHDPDNRVVLITGTGDQFSGPAASRETFPAGDIAAWERIRRNGIRLTMNLLEIDVPMISCINGPALRHPEIALLADIVLAAERATIQDTAHFANGLVPGDGMNVVLPLLMGYNRGRYHLLTGKSISAQDALAWGLVSEVLPNDQLLARGRELATELARRNPLVLRYTRLLFTQPLKKTMHDILGYGLALEAIAAVEESERRVR
jgi:enoyl-CoA hydratase/carnithine racemase